MPPSTWSDGANAELSAEDQAILAELAIPAPLDPHDAVLLDNVHPRNHTDPDPTGVVYDLVALGAGAAGLVSAKQSARRGARSALIEMHLAGGDCLNVGCVPSKALIRVARAVKEAKHMDSLGVCVRTRAHANAHARCSYIPKLITGSPHRSSPAAPCPLTSPP